jgi:hypothetical protein
MHSCIVYFMQTGKTHKDMQKTQAEIILIKEKSKTKQAMELDTCCNCLPRFEFDYIPSKIMPTKSQRSDLAGGALRIPFRELCFVSNQQGRCIVFLTPLASIKQSPTTPHARANHNKPTKAYSDAKNRTNLRLFQMSVTHTLKRQ